jgi:hypothetical protein
MMTRSSVTNKEFEALEASPVCLNCHHRAILHHFDESNWIHVCQVCRQCDSLIVEGDMSYWSVKNALARKKDVQSTFESVADYTNRYVTQRMTAMMKKDLHLGEGGANDA